MSTAEDASTTTSQAPLHADAHDAVASPPPFEVGDRVRFESRESKGTGIVDAAMPDGSVIWVWPDDAMGRKMLHVAEDAWVRLERRRSA